MSTRSRGTHLTQGVYSIAYVPKLRREEVVTGWTLPNDHVISDVCSCFVFNDLGCEKFNCTGTIVITAHEELQHKLLGTTPFDPEP